MFEVGFKGRGIADQVARYTPGMDLVAIRNRSIDAAIDAYARAGVADVPVMSTPAELDDEVRRDGHAVADGLLSGPHSERVQVVARRPRTSSTAPGSRSRR